MTDQKETQKSANRRGHNAMMTGLALLVIGGIFAITGNGSGMTGFGVLVAVAGLVATIIGIGLRRETPPD